MTNSQFVQYIKIKEVNIMRIELIENNQIDWNKRVKYKKSRNQYDNCKNLKKSNRMGYTYENKIIKKYGFKGVDNYDCCA